MPKYVSPISDSALKTLCGQLEIKNRIELDDYWKYGVKRGLRNTDGTGVMAGLTKICSVEGYYIDDGEKVPKDGVLKYRGYNLNSFVDACDKENRFGFEEVAWLLLFGSLPTEKQLKNFRDILSECRELPTEFIDDMIMKNPSKDVMNKMARCVLALYSLDDNPDDLSIDNVLKQSIHLIAQLPIIMCYAYQIKRRIFYGKTMFLHPINPEYDTAQTILNAIRPDRFFTFDEAKLLDTCLMIHAEHGGGNNSTFTSRVLTSTGTDTYSTIAAAIGSLKGPRHGGANMKVCEMMDYLENDVNDITDEGQVADFLTRVIRKQAGDHSGLIYGMGHAVYTKSDPRAVILKKKATEYAEKSGYSDYLKALELIERLTPEIFKREKGETKRICANVDLYSGLVYKILGIPEDIYTPLFAVARVAGWSAHRIEELMTSKKIMRPGYKSVALPHRYINISNRTEDLEEEELYIPSEARY